LRNNKEEIKMNTAFNLIDLKLRVDAIEFLLIARGETNKENLAIFRKEAEQNDYKAREEFQQAQWAKIKIGGVIEYELTPTSRLVLEILSISPEPFRFLAGKICNKSGKSSYKLGEIFTISHVSKLELRTMTGSAEIIRRD